MGQPLNVSACPHERRVAERLEPLVPRWGLSFVVQRCAACGVELCGDARWPLTTEPTFTG